jgi:hypothetical protein
MRVRFYIDSETDEPHIYDHGVTELEVEQVLASRGEDLPGSRNSRIKLGQSNAGRYLQVIYVPDSDDPHSLFVITAYDLRGKALKAFRRRHKRKPI